MKRDWRTMYKRGFDDGHKYGLHDGREAERAAIVAWLRDMAQRYAEIHDVPVAETAADLYSSLIKHGEHLRGDDE